MKKIISLLLLSLLLVGVLAGCADFGVDVSYAYIGGKISSLDPAKASGRVQETYIKNLYSGLYYYELDESGYPVLKCGDAESLPKVKELDNGMYELTFTLKEGLIWSKTLSDDETEEEGTLPEAVTPRDYVYSWNRAASILMGSEKSYLFSLIDGYESFTEYKEDAALNMSYDNKSRTFTVVIKEDSERFLSYTTECALFPVSRIAIRDNDDWDTNPSHFASNGRYKLSSLDSQSLAIDKNERYRDSENTKCERIKFLFDIEEAEKKADEGKLAFSSVNADTSIYQKKNGEIATASSYIAFNANDRALGLYSEEEKAKIRRALCFYINDSGVLGDGKALLSPMLKKENSFSSMSEEEADKLLSEVAQSSGHFTYQEGRVYEFPILTALCAGRNGEQKKLASIADKLASKGINLSVINCTWEEFLECRVEGNYSLLINSRSYNSLFPADMLSIFSSKSVNNDTMAGTANGGIDWNEYDGAISVKTENLSSSKDSYIKALVILEESGLVLPIMNSYFEYFLADKSFVDVSYDGIVIFK